MTDYVYYVNPAANTGGDGTADALTGANCAYQSLNAAITARASTPGATDTITYRCSGNGSSWVDSTAVDVTGHAAGCLITIEGYNGNYVGRQLGAAYDNTNCYALEVSAANTRTIVISQAGVTLRHLQLDNTSASIHYQTVYDNGNNGLTIDSCRLRLTKSNSSIPAVCIQAQYGTDVFKLLNSTIEGNSNASEFNRGIYMSRNSESFDNIINNNTIYGFCKGIYCVSYVKFYAHNNVIANCADDWDYYTISGTQSHNADSGDGDTPGSNNVTLSTTLTDEFTDPSNGDFTVASNGASNNIWDAGTSGGGIPAVDIIGTSRSNYSIGAWEYVSAGATGTGDLVGAGSEVVGTGTRAITGTGALEGQGSAIVGTGQRVITGAGALIGQGSDVAGTGATGGVHTGTGDLIGAGSEVVGVGERTITGTGVLVAQGSAVVGVGERTIIGYGDLVGAGAEVSGSGAVGGITTGTGDLVGAGSEVVGTGLRTVTGSGALVAQGSAVTGTGERTVTGAGALVGSGSEIIGAGVGGDVKTGAGALFGQGSAVTGTGTRKITGVGELVAAGSIIVGSGLRTITGYGALVGAGSEVVGGQTEHDFETGNINTWMLGPRGRVWSLENRDPYDAHKRGREVCS